jgi:hypothetical protein
MTKPKSNEFLADLAARLFERIVSGESDGQLKNNLLACDQTRPSGSHGRVEVDGETLRLHQLSEARKIFSNAARQACDLATVLVEEIERRYDDQTEANGDPKPTVEAIVRRLKRDPHAVVETFAGQLAEKMIEFHKFDVLGDKRDQGVNRMLGYLEQPDFNPMGYFAGSAQPSSSVAEAATYTLQRVLTNAVPKK